MTYDYFLFLCIYKTMDTEFNQSEYRDQYEKLPSIYQEFLDSEFNKDDEDIYQCIENWINSFDWVNLVECSCGEWEEIPSNSPRHHIRGFDWLSNCDDGTAYYQCPDCGETVHSNIVRN